MKDLYFCKNNIERFSAYFLTCKAIFALDSVSHDFSFTLSRISEINKKILIKRRNKNFLC